MPNSIAVDASRSGLSMVQRLTPQQAAADQPDPERDEQTGERLFLDLTAHRLDRPAALRREASVELVGLVAQTFDGIARRLRRGIVSAVLHMTHQARQIALQRCDVVA